MKVAPPQPVVGLSLLILLLVGAPECRVSALTTDSGHTAFTVPAEEFYALEAQDIDGRAVKFSDLQNDKVIFIINVASKCGKTDISYKQLAFLHNKYGSSGLKILAFPCNQFDRQE